VLMTLFMQPCRHIVRGKSVSGLKQTLETA
jgi:hypothetical protein